MGMGLSSLDIYDKNDGTNFSSIVGNFLFSRAEVTEKTGGEVE